MGYEYIRAELRGRVGLITLDRPRQMNALNPKLMQELAQALHGFDADDGVGARIEGVFLPEDLHANHVLLQIAAAAGGDFFDDEGQEPPQPIGLPSWSRFAGVQCRWLLGGLQGIRSQLQVQPVGLMNRLGAPTPWLQQVMSPCGPKQVQQQQHQCKPFHHD